MVQQQYALTNQALRVVNSDLGQINGSFSAQAQQEASTARTALGDLPFLRTASTQTALPALVVVQKYTQMLDSLLALIDVTGQGASDATLGQAIRVLGLVSRMKEEASQQRGILAAGLLQKELGANELNALISAESQQQSNLQSFNTSASIAQRQLWNNSVATSFVFQANAEETQAIATAQAANGSLAGEVAYTPDDWFGAMSNEVDTQMGSVEQALSAQITARAATLHRDALIAALAVGLVVLLVLGLSLILTVVVGRSMVRPLRRLRAGALEVAGVRLPDMVRRMSETDGTGVSFDVAPIDVDSSDEIGEVARAFDQVHREALRLAANEAALRGNVNAMFVNLSRRSQSLVERQIRLIDDLEQGEQDPERLANLFQMDHLATRMRRNSENLLVLAGHEVSRRWNQPVALVDVLRAAVSEIEQYERVSMNVQPGISARGQAVNDVVHLVAELVENATSFSSAETPVTVSGHLLNSGGVLLDISDQGVGMGAEEMAHANWRLDNPPVVDVAVSRRMGLFVVARLAARHGIRVRLRPAPTGGLTALVWLPDETVTHEGVGPAMPGGRRLGSNGSGTPDSVEPLTTGGEWGPRRGRNAAEEAVNAARAPRFAPLHAENGDSAATAGFPAISPSSSSWEDNATKAPGPSWGDWPGSAPAAPAWDGPAAKPDGGPSWMRPRPSPLRARGTRRRPSPTGCPGTIRRSSRPRRPGRSGRAHPTLRRRPRRVPGRCPRCPAPGRCRPSVLRSPVTMLASRRGCPPARYGHPSATRPARYGAKWWCRRPPRWGRATGCRSSSRWNRTGSGVAGTALTGPMAMPLPLPVPRRKAAQAGHPPQTMGGGPRKR